MKNPRMFGFPGKGTLKITAQTDIFLPVHV